MDDSKIQPKTLFQISYYSKMHKLMQHSYAINVSAAAHVTHSMIQSLISQMINQIIWALFFNPIQN